MNSVEPTLATSLNLYHSFSMFAKFFEKLTYMCEETKTNVRCAYQGVRNVIFSENFGKVEVVLEMENNESSALSTLPEFDGKENLYYVQKQPPEVFYEKKVFLDITQNSQENTCG